MTSIIMFTMNGFDVYGKSEEEEQVDVEVESEFEEIDAIFDYSDDDDFIVMVRKMVQDKTFFSSNLSLDEQSLLNKIDNDWSLGQEITKEDIEEAFRLNSIFESNGYVELMKN